MIRDLRPDVVAIDSPPRWAPSGRSRLTERQLAALNISSFNTPSEAHGRGNRFFAWMEVGFDVFVQAAAAGFPTYSAGSPEGKALEVFPHATAVVLAGCLPPRGTRKHVWRRPCSGPKACAPTSSDPPIASTPPSPHSPGCMRSTGGDSLPAIRERA